MSNHGQVSDARDGEEEEHVAALFRDAGWSVARVDRPGRAGDLAVTKGAVSYVVEVKRSREPRPDRVIPLVSQAVLQARTNAERLSSAAPLVVVVGKRIPKRLIAQVEDFLRVHAPDVVIGFVDETGLRDFRGAGLEKLNRPAGSAASFSDEVSRTVDLFSDLNQWLLKTVFAADLADPRLLNAPLARYRNASELARRAAVSLMTAVRFVGALKASGYVDDQSEFIRLVRMSELLERWRAAVVRPAATIRARWLFPGDRQVQMQRWAPLFGDDVCLGLYAAADVLGFGIARGVSTHLYFRRLPHDLKSMGLVRVTGESEAHVVLRVPAAKESVFRASVIASGVRSSDILQAWLDVGHDPVRGREQAEHIYRRVIGPMLERAGTWPEQAI